MFDKRSRITHIHPHTYAHAHTSSQVIQFIQIKAVRVSGENPTWTPGYVPDKTARGYLSSVQCYVTTISCFLSGETWITTIPILTTSEEGEQARFWFVMDFISQPTYTR